MKPVMKPVVAKIINSSGQDMAYLTYRGGAWDLTISCADAYVFDDRYSAIAMWNEIRSSSSWIAEIPAEMKPVDW
jgi:hypothetical protein